MLTSWLQAELNLPFRQQKYIDRISELRITGRAVVLASYASHHVKGIARTGAERFHASVNVAKANVPAARLTQQVLKAAQRG